jgi:LisH domain-containing protein ARMC9
MVVRTHVNGTLYSILTRKALKAQARSLGMQEMLFYLMENSDEQLKKQIQYILNQLNTEEAKDGDTDAEDENEEEDYDDDYGDEDVGEDGEDDDDEEEPFENEADIMDEDIDKLHD